MSSKDDVLIVDDSPAIGMLLKSYLEKLGYTQIHICGTGSAAITTFDELVSKNKLPIVLLDFMLPDMDARSVLTQMIVAQPSVRVILETATEKDDEGVKELIRLGVYQYLEKPIRFESLKNIIEIIEKEESFFKKESEQVELLKEAKEEEEGKVRENIDFIFKAVNQISLNKITDILGVSNDLTTSYLQKLEQEGKIIQLGEKKEITCNSCDSLKTSQIFFCPNCKSSNFKLGKLIEHYDCGNVSEENTYQNDECPSWQNHYICNDCEEFFPEISIEYLCLKCQNRFKLEDARWSSSINYKVK